MYLTFHNDIGTDGKRHLNLKAIITYEAPAERFEKRVDKRKTMYVEFTDDPENAIICYTDSKFYKSEKISAVEALSWLDELKVLKNKFKSHKSAAGNPHKNWGSKRINKVVDGRRFNLTRRTENGKMYRNHLWTKRIISAAIRWRAGNITIVNLPNGVLSGHPWATYQFAEFLKYKANEVGGKVTVYKAAEVAQEEYTVQDATQHHVPYKVFRNK